MPDRNPDEYLEDLAKEGLERRLARPTPLPAGAKPPKTRPEYDERLAWELSVILKMGLSSYFLIVWDFIKYAKDEGIPVGPGRGSAAGSLVAWALGITDVDPLRYDLLFERFLNPDRISMPDIDVDLCERRRGEVIEYVRRKYGRDNVGQIITFNSMKARAVIRDVGRVLDVPLAEVNRLCSLIPANPGKPTTLAEARRDVKELSDALRDNETYRRLFDLGERLEGVSRHAGVHAAGVLIAPRPLVEYLPLYRNSNDEITTQFEMKSVDRMGLLKMDFLGLITLTILDDALGFVEKKTGARPELETIPLDDPEVYRLFADGRTDAVFQFESSGMRDLLRRVRPEVFEDLAALNALYRPGALDAGTVETYIERRRGRKFEYPLPQLEPILKDTHGVLVYQEQVMLAARAVAGYSPGEADKLRKAIGKKDEALLKAEGDKFIKKAVAAGTPKRKAEELWSLILPFGRYGFNKSHSVVYALLAYRTAWMKVHHPVEFLAATLTASSGSSDDVVKYVNTCREMKIPVLPPDVNKSELSFTPDGDAIRFGLGAVKGVGEGAVASVLGTRAGDGAFKSLTDFCSRVDLRLNNRRVIEALVKSGCFDSLGKTRAALLDGLDMAIDVAAAAREAATSNQSLLFEVPADAQIEDRFGDKPEMSADEKIRFEKETLGFYITGHPLTRFEEEIRVFGDATCETLHERLDAPVKLVGLVSSVKKNQIKKGQNEGKLMAKAIVEDLTGTVPVTVFASLLERVSGWFAPGRAVLVTGTVRSSMPMGAAAASADHEGEGASLPVEVIAREIQPLEGMKEQAARRGLHRAVELRHLRREVRSARFSEGSRARCPSRSRLRRPGHFAAPPELDPRTSGSVPRRTSRRRWRPCSAPDPSVTPTRRRHDETAPGGPGARRGGSPGFPVPHRRDGRPAGDGPLARRRSDAGSSPRPADAGRRPRRRGRRRERAPACGQARRDPGLVPPRPPRTLRHRDAGRAGRPSRRPRGHTPRGVPRSREPSRRHGHGDDRRRPRPTRLHDPRDGAPHRNARARRRDARPFRREARPRGEDAPPPPPEVARRRPDPRVPRGEVRGEARVRMGQGVRKGAEARPRRRRIRRALGRPDEEGNRRDFLRR